MKNDFLDHPFVALLTNNGYPMGFKPLLAYSQNPHFVPLEQAHHSNLILICSYDLKNRFEALHSSNNSNYIIDDFTAIQPEHFEFISEQSMKQLLQPAIDFNVATSAIRTPVKKETYIHTINQLKNEIQQGNIYEINYCMEFYVQSLEIDPFELFKHYNSIAQSPMSAYLKLNDLHVLCGSPERFIKKEKSSLISQPIKGTRKRGPNDLQLIKELEEDKKERAENIMIVDLVRNDLSKIAERGSVQVEELCKVYTFNTVHQSISTIAAKVDEHLHLQAILKACFPMGSMTGAPKLKAMELIEQYEHSKRQLYSGSIGYCTINNDIDLNVVIRTMIYDQKNKYLSFMVGGAITAYCDPEKEYEECLIKAQGILKSLNTDIEK